MPAIGWREWLALPALGIPAVKAKIDTGARTSALHAFDLHYSERNGTKWVRFSVHPQQRNARHKVTAEARVAEFRAVRSSSGHSERRPVIHTTVEALGTSWTIELTLTNRDEMGFRMLLGREAVRNRFVVDPGRSYYSGQPAAPPAATIKKKSKRKSSKKSKKKKAATKTQSAATKQRNTRTRRKKTAAARTNRKGTP